MQDQGLFEYVEVALVLFKLLLFHAQWIHTRYNRYNGSKSGLRTKII